MQELRLVAVSEDGTYVILAQPGRGTRFSLPNDERLRAVVRGQFSRLAQYEIEVESPLRPKEIQTRIRAGETAEQIADAAGVPIERVRWFEGPVLAERAYMAQQAQAASVRRPGDSGPGPRLGEIVAERLHLLGADPEEARWDSRKRGDGSWLVELVSDADGEPVTATWIFDARRRHAVPDDDVAARLSLPEEALAADALSAQPPPPVRTVATVTPFVPRSGPASRPAAPVHREPAAAPAPPATKPPVTKPAAPAPPAPKPAAGPARAAAAGTGRDDDATPPALRRRAARLGPQASPSDLPRLRAPGPDTAMPAAGAAAGGAAGDDGSTAGDAAEPPPRARSGRKAAGGRGRRASVPTWDEIMFGSSRPQE